MGAGGPLVPRPPARLGVSWAVDVRSKRCSCALLGDAVVLAWKPWRARWLCGVLVRLNLTGERDRAREGVVFDEYVFSGDRDRTLDAVFSLLEAFMVSTCSLASLSLPRGSGSCSSSGDRLGQLVRD